MDISVNEYIKRYTADQDYSINFFIAVSKYVLGVTNYSDTYKVTKKYGRNALSDFLSFLPQGLVIRLSPSVNSYLENQIRR